MEGLQQAKERILAAKEIVIASHVNPDGDSIGSLLSLGLALEKLGKRVYMICQDTVPKRYRRLPGARRVTRKVAMPADLAIAVDCSNKEILGSAYEFFTRAGAILEIDHHDFRRPFGDTELIDTKAAAVGEIIYVLLKELGIEMTHDIAQNIMTSIMVETNSFRLPNVRSFTFEVCLQLINVGVDVYKLVDMIFWSNRREAAILSGLCLARCEFLRGGRIAWSIVRKKDFDAVKGRDEDIDAVPDDMRSIGSVRIAVLFRERDKQLLRVSLRSKGRINVAAIAEHYGGGGHFDVAGCTIPNTADSMRDVLRRVGHLLI